MCGRKTITKAKEEIIEELLVDDWEEDFEYLPNYNVSPSQQNPILTLEQGKRKVSAMSWGLIPHWAKDSKLSHKMINARSENLTEKASYRSLLNTKRCVVIADGYYEWKQDGKVRTPYYFRHPEGKILAMAGLFSSWISPEKGLIYTYTIITRMAFEKWAFVHDRMPSILLEDILTTWLDTTHFKFDDVAQYLGRTQLNLEGYPVSKNVNSPKNNSKELIQPVAER